VNIRLMRAPAVFVVFPCGDFADEVLGVVDSPIQALGKAAARPDGLRIADAVALILRNGQQDREHVAANTAAEM
jgi:hypothetical protein